ncbi:MAG: hypothetical protein GXY83_43590 [Rhodopirellula sp.]|nr:hypothetical protein [Rhodopirellula sp.]
MGRMPWGVYLWPGLPQLWVYGAWQHLAASVAFAMLLNLAILSTFLWSELLSPGARNLAWLAVFAVWVFSALFSLRRGHRPQDEPSTPNDRFREAQDHYLRGEWFEAERLLVGQLHHNPRDVDSRLMLATLLRHRSRFDEAVRHLDRLQRLEGSEKWSLEIQREWDLLAENRQSETDAAEPEPAEAAAREVVPPADVAA